MRLHPTPESHKAFGMADSQLLTISAFKLFSNECLVKSFFVKLFKSKVKVVGLHPTPDQGGLLVLSSLDSPRRPNGVESSLGIKRPYAIASDARP